MYRTQTTSPSLFHHWFQGKEWYQQLLRTGACPLGLNDTLAWSFMIYRTRMGGTTMAEIARATRLDQGRTVPAIVKKLMAMNLAADQKGRIVALAPPDPAWLSWRDQNAEPWYEGARKFPICPPPKSWTPAQTVIYFCLLTRNVQSGRKIHHHQKKAGIAAMLGVSHDTVQRAFKKFEGLGLLEYDYLQDPPKEVLDLFQNKPEPAKMAFKAPWKASIACGWKFGTLENGASMARMVDGYSKTMLAAEYTREDVVTYLAKLRQYAERKGEVLNEFLWEWESLFRKVEEQTARNRAEGKFSGRNSLGLLLPASESRIKTIKYNKEFIPQAGNRLFNVNSGPAS